MQNCLSRSTFLLQMPNQRDRIFWCYMSKECATATVIESLASRLQMSGGPSNDSRSSATPVTVREAAESVQSTPLGTACSSKNASNEFESVDAKNCSEIEKYKSVRKIAKQELKLKPYKLQRVQLLMTDNKSVRLERCRRFLRRVTPLNCERILFTNVNYLPSNQPTINRTTAGTSAIVEHRQNPKSMLVFAGICATGKAPLVLSMG